MALPRVIGHVAKLHSMGLGIYRGIGHNYQKRYASAYGLFRIRVTSCQTPGHGQVAMARWPGIDSEIEGTVRHCACQER